MGEMHDLRCNKCGYGVKAYLGIGMLYSPEKIFGADSMLSELVQDDTITKTAMTKIDHGVEPNENYRHDLYACPQDNYLFTKFYFELTDGFIPEYHCQYCQSVLKRVTFAKARGGVTKLEFVDNPGMFWSCPHCGNDTLKEFSFGNWD